MKKNALMLGAYMNSLCDRTTLARSLPLSNHYTAILLGYHQNTMSRTYSDVIMPSYITIRRGGWRTHKRIMDSSRRLPWGIRCTCICNVVYRYTLIPQVHGDCILYGHTSGVKLTRNRWFFSLSSELHSVWN